MAIKLLELEQLGDAGCAGIESARALAVTGGGYKRRLQTAVTNGSCVVSETEMKPKRNRNEDAAPGLGVRCPGPMCCAMVGGGVGEDVNEVWARDPDRAQRERAKTHT